MAADISKRFLDDSEDGALNNRGQPGFIDRAEVERDINAGAAGEGFDVPLQAGDQAQVVENLRPQSAANISDSLKDFVGERLGFLQCFDRRPGAIVFAAAQHDFESGQILADLVVQFARDAALFRFVGEDKLLAERAKLSVTVAEFLRAFLEADFQANLRLLRMVFLSAA